MQKKSTNRLRLENNIRSVREEAKISRNEIKKILKISLVAIGKLESRDLTKAIFKYLLYLHKKTGKDILEMITNHGKPEPVKPIKKIKKVKRAK